MEERALGHMGKLEKYNRKGFMAMQQSSQKQALVVGEGKDMQFNPTLWNKWQNDACDADDWKHGRVSDLFRNNYDNIQWE